LDIRAAGLTDIGLKREGNEDAFSSDRENGLFIVADGMGGHLAGEVASRIAVEMISTSFQRWTSNETPVEELYGEPDASLTVTGNYLSSSIRLANRVVYELAREYDRYHGMGTTAAVIHVTPSLIVAANAGDSRIYLIRAGRLERLSRDHTVVSEQVESGMMTPEEAETSPLKHVLTRNLGSSEDVEVEVYEIEPSNGDRFVLCSDGVTDLVSDREILEMTRGEEDPQALCRKLVQTALGRGGHDNTTVVAAFVEGIAGAKGPPLKKLWGVLADAVIGVQKAVKKFKP
jgi:protein phosphatase